MTSSLGNRLFVSLICLGPYSDLLSLGLVSWCLLVCLRMSFLFQIGRSKEHFSTFDSQIRYPLVVCGVRFSNHCVWLVLVYSREVVWFGNQRCDDFGGIGGFLVVGHLCDF